MKYDNSDHLYTSCYSYNACNKQIPKKHKELIQEILSYDPRPSYKRDDNKEYHVKILHYDVGFYVLKSEIFISKIILLI